MLETFLYDEPGKVCHEKVDSFRVSRGQNKGEPEQAHGSK
jgi:hypothetical protein